MIERSYISIFYVQISPSRKRMKHKQHIPDRIEWAPCLRCGEPKRPHRICTAHIDICAMRDEEYEAHLKKKGSEVNDIN